MALALWKNMKEPILLDGEPEVPVFGWWIAGYPGQWPASSMPSNALWKIIQQ